MGDRRWEIGDRRWEIGDGRWEMEDISLKPKQQYSDLSRWEKPIDPSASNIDIIPLTVGKNCYNN
jgi:hypothetical protein